MKYHWLVASCFLAIGLATTQPAKGRARSATQTPGRQSGTGQRNPSGNQSESPPQEAGPSRKRQRTSDQPTGPSSPRIDSGKSQRSSSPESQANKSSKSAGLSPIGSEFSMSPSGASSILHDDRTTMRTKVQGVGSIAEHAFADPDIKVSRDDTITHKKTGRDKLSTFVSLRGRHPRDKATVIAKGRRVTGVVDTTGGGSGHIKTKDQNGRDTIYVPPGRIVEVSGKGADRGWRVGRAKWKAKVRGKATIEAESNMDSSSASEASSGHSSN